MSSIFFRSATFAFAAWMLFEAIQQIRSEWQVAALTDLARRVENGVIPEPGYWARFDGVNGHAIRTAAACYNPALKADLTVNLAKFDSMSRGSNLQARDAQRLAAIAAAERTVHCAPMDGNAWFRLGLLELGAEGPTPEVLAHFSAADHLAPNEGWLIRIRAPIYADLANRGLTAFRDQAIHDAKVFTAFGHDAARAMNWLAAWPNLLRDGFMEGLAFVSLRERRWYFALASDYGVDIGQPTKATIIIDPFTGKPFNKDVKN